MFFAPGKLRMFTPNWLDQRAIDLGEFHFEQDFARLHRGDLHQAGDFRRGVLHHFQNFSATAAEEHARTKSRIFGGFDLHGFGRENFVNFFAQAQDVDVDGNFERLALVLVVPQHQRNAAGGFAVDEHLLRAYDDRVSDGRISQGNALEFAWVT